jgi:antitoxin component YwqK of YwqJK toxin-antitoxin module
LFFTIAYGQDTTFTLIDPAQGLKMYEVMNPDGSTETGSLRNGRKDGMVRTFFANGVLMSAKEYQDNQLNGWSLECEKNGVVLNEAYFINGVLNGEFRVYTTAKGVRIVKSVYHYKDGIFHGTCTEYNDSGKISAMSTYNEGIKDGTSRWYFTNGLMAMEQQYKAGLLNGRETIYHNNGKVASETTYVSNTKSGISKEYYPSGIMKAMGEYDADTRIGVWNFYDEEGNLSSTETY